LSVVLFSSRRRHTRSKRDWSSDVCSSDLFNSILRTIFIDTLLGRALISIRQSHMVSYQFVPPIHPLLLLRLAVFRLIQPALRLRSEERRVGKEGRSRCGRSE